MATAIVTMDSDSNELKYKTISDLRREEERLISEIERRTRRRRSINRRSSRIKALRDFLNMISPVNENDTDSEEENDRMTERMNKAFEDYCRVSRKNFTFYDEFVIHDENVKPVAEVTAIISIKNKQPEKEHNIQIKYEFKGNQIKNTCVVLNDKDSGAKLPAEEEPRPSTSRIGAQENRTDDEEASVKVESSSDAETSKVKDENETSRDRDGTSRRRKNSRESSPYEDQFKIGRTDSGVRIRNARGRFVKKG